MRGFRQFSSHLTKCNTCHGICTLPPLDAALPLRFAKITQHDTSKVLCLPRKMTMDTSKVLRLPRNLQLILRKRRKSIASATQNDFQHVTKHVWHKVPRLPREMNNATCETSKSDPFCRTYHGHGHRLRTVANGCGRLRTVANGCRRLRTVANGCEHTTLKPQTPRVKRESLLRIREKAWDTTLHVSRPVGGFLTFWRDIEIPM